MTFSFLLLLAIPGVQEVAAQHARFAAAPQLAARIDAFTEQHWQANQIKPAALTDDATFLRRLTLDLAGRIPTIREATTFVADPAPDKRARAIRRLMESPEYALHLGRVLDDTIQEKFAGDPEFLDYLRSAVAEHRPWDRIFREILLGPWDAPQRKDADRFLLKRLRSLDDLTNDTARVFFGVNVSCAKCHNHPLVADWTQDHYYGMASFFNRTQEAAGKGKGKGKGAKEVQEKTTGEVSFVTVKGDRRSAKVMFLSSRVLEEPGKSEPGSAPIGRRALLVRVALEDRTYFRRAIVNRLWAYLLGRGLVHPVDQMHSANPPSVPGLLEWLGDDLAGHGYDLDRLIAGIVSSRVYQEAGVQGAAAESPAAKHFAVATLRPLTPQQFVLSMVLATGEGMYDQASDPRERGRRYRELEGQIAGLTKLQVLDPRSDRFQSSAGEALFVSNHPDIQRLVMPAGNNLTSRLSRIADSKQLIETAVWTVLGRPPEAEEQAYLARWVEEHKQDRGQTCGELVWALLASAEFRFNH